MAEPNIARRMTPQRRLKSITRKLRELSSIGSALASTSHPYMAHIVPMRRCNLACTYCNEYDDFSDPVPIAEMERRIDELGRLGTSVITISGGEPLLHPDLDRSSADELAIGINVERCLGLDAYSLSLEVLHFTDVQVASKIDRGKQTREFEGIDASDYTRIK